MRERVEASCATVSLGWINWDGEHGRLVTEAVATFRQYLRGALGEELRRYADWLAKL